MYPSTEKLNKMLEVSELFVTSQFVDGLKPKREKVIRDEYGNTYDIQLEIRSLIKLIDISHLLGHDETFIPYLVDEYSRLKIYCQILTEELSRMKSVHEHKDSVKLLLDTFKGSDMLSLLVEDLKHIEETFDMNINIHHRMSYARSFMFTADEMNKLNERLNKYYDGKKNPRRNK